MKIHKPDVYFAYPPSQFDLSLLETGNEVDVLARDLFPNGVIVESRDDLAYTKKLIGDHTDIIYQPVFETDAYKTACDIFVWNEVAQGYDVYEVKASNSGEDKAAKDKLYAHDLAFQYNVLRELSVPLNKLCLIRLNREYVRGSSLNIEELFTKEDFTDRVLQIADHVKDDMKQAYEVLSSDAEPFGSCACIIRGRSAQCTAFSYSNPQVPEYSVHDIARIGSSKKKLQDLVDRSILSIYDVPDDYQFSVPQQNQILIAKNGQSIICKEEIRSFLNDLRYPLSFLDYETFPAGVPRFPGYHPFDQIPFQFSLHVLDEDAEECSHSEFLFSESSNPDKALIVALREAMPATGSVIVWNKSFEMTINSRLVDRNPEYRSFLEDINARIVDLKEIFDKQYFVHPDFKGRTSIKRILPVLAPELSYKALDIQEGATASDTWNKIVSGEYSKEVAVQKIQSLKIYCGLDTYAMYAIWKYLMIMF
ncbi:MAG: DUF2779 domain-containing protein [bacterium]|nr:DUF2779 domain-containing protein [bacterium]